MHGCHRFLGPGRIRVESRHSRNHRRCLRSEVLRIHDTVVVDDECHYAGRPPPRWPRDECKAADHPTIDDVVICAASGIRTLRCENLEQVSVVGLRAVAMRFQAKQVLMVQTHYFNTSTSRLDADVRLVPGLGQLPFPAGQQPLGADQRGRQLAERMELAGETAFCYARNAAPLRRAAAASFARGVTAKPASGSRPGRGSNPLSRSPM